MCEYVLCSIEATALRLITGTDEIKLISESKSLVSTESEELNKALVLTLARCIHISGIVTRLKNSCFKIPTP